MTWQEAASRVASLVDRRVSPAELREAIERPLTDEEREQILSLSRWFCRLPYAVRAPGLRAAGVSALAALCGECPACNRAIWRRVSAGA